MSCFMCSLFSAHLSDSLNSLGRPAIGIYQNQVWQNGFSHCPMQGWERHLRRLLWHESGQVSPQGKHVSSCGLFVFYMAWGPWFFSWLYNSAGVLWLLLPCFALLCFCSFFFFLNYCMFLKTWFSWALMGYGTRSADQLHLGKSHLSNWEKINSWCPKETDINQAADVLEIQHWLPSLHSAILRSYLGTDFLRGSPLTVNSFDVLILPYFTTMSFILLLKGI